MLFTMIWKKYYQTCITFHFSFLRQIHRCSNATQRQKWMQTGYAEATGALQCQGSTKQQTGLASLTIIRYWLIDLEGRLCCPGRHRGAWASPLAPCNSKTAFGLSPQLSQRRGSASVGKAAVLEPFSTPSAVLQAAQSSEEGVSPGPGTPTGCISTQRPGTRSCTAAGSDWLS